ncbi:MAG: 4Fe-4S dicluster domain-containing protein [Thermodesulfobacteriota bacterium]
MIKVSDDLCIGCGSCINVCPSGALNLIFGKARIDFARCNSCGVCVSVCSVGAIESIPVAEIEELRKRIQNMKRKMEFISKKVNSLYLRRKGHHV